LFLVAVPSAVRAGSSASQPPSQSDPNTQRQCFPTCGPWTPEEGRNIAVGFQIYLLQNDYNICFANTVLFLKLLFFWWRWALCEFIYYWI